MRKASARSSADTLCNAAMTSSASCAGSEPRGNTASSIARSATGPNSSPMTSRTIRIAARWGSVVERHCLSGLPRSCRIIHPSLGFWSAKALLAGFAKFIVGAKIHGTFTSKERQAEWSSKMRYGPTANPDQVTAMSRVLAAYCRKAGINPETPEGKRVASLILALHEVGIRGENEFWKALVAPKQRLPRGLHWG